MTSSRTVSAGARPADNVCSMATEPSSFSGFRVEKQRVDAVLTLSSGESADGCFFVAGGSARHAGPERVGDLLNSEAVFIPFETHDSAGVRTLLVNRRHVVMVAIRDNEASRDPGYAVATRRVVSVLLSDGHRVVGTVRVYQPEGRDRLSDWARYPEIFRYVETDETTLIVNMAHVIEVNEVTER
jgi:hypothetical protein